MTALKKLAFGVATTVLAATLAATAAQAQETAGGINGAVTDNAGRPVSNANVRVLFRPTNQSFTATTDASGQFTLRNLPVGGPYEVTTTDASHSPKTVTVESLPLGQAYQLNVAMMNPGEVQAVVVTASRLRGQTVQTGPRSTFTAADIQTLPTFSRDIKDIIRLNPFVSIDPTNNNALIISGNNNRFNTTYVDGVKQSDDFGLNANGYPTLRSPVSIDLVQSTNVEIAPYDVQYGSFQGGLVNIVTKSGTNEFHGTAFYEYDSDNLGAGQQYETNYTGRRAVQLQFQDRYYGFTLGGPILKNRLFFEFGYEKYEGLPVGGTGPSDAAGVANPVPGITLADVQQIQSIVKSVYGYDVGTYGVAAQTEDTKIFGKLTWLINDKQRFVFEAQQTAGSTFSNPGSSVSARQLGLFSNSYNFVQPLEAYTGFLYSNWTPSLSTELSYTYRTVGGVTSNNGATPFARFRINLGTGATSSAVFIGPDVSRQANALDYSDTLLRARVNYTMGRHTLTAGYEREELNVFNLFVQNATGDYTFAPTIVGGVVTQTVFQNLQNRTALSLNYANAANNDFNSGAANWGDVLNTFYLQDQWRPFAGVTISAGLRAELYEQSDKPQANSFFQSLYGISNQATLDGKYVIMPRLGVNWRPEPTLTINGGFGLFSGGSPNVWISNNYSNTGNRLGAVNVSCPSGTTTQTPGCNPALVGVTGTSIPATVTAANTASANLQTGITNALDPKFEPPSVWKASIGAQKSFNFAEMGWTGWLGRLVGNEWRLHADYLYQKTNEAVTWIDLLSAGNVAGTAPDGRPIYNPGRYTARKLTNSYDLLLTNTDKGWTQVWTVGVGKSWSNGFDFDFSYTHTDARDVNPGTSSVALSNYSQVAFSDANNPGLSISNYQIKNQMKLNAGFQHNFFGDLRSSVRLYAQRRSGLPFSYTFDSPATSGTSFDPVFGLAGAVAQRDQQLLYVPATDSTGNVTATSDPKVTYGATFDVAAFNAFLKQTGLIQYAGRISERNAFTSRDVTQVDLAFTQEIPAPIPFIAPNAKGELFLNVFNIGNMVNPSWGVLDQYGFPYVYPAVVTSLTCGAPLAAGGLSACPAGTSPRYLYNSFATRAPTVNTGGSPPASLWAIKIGIRFKF